MTGPQDTEGTAPKDGPPPQDATGTPSYSDTLDVPVRSPCPNCGAVETRRPYDIGSGPELACADCEWCWGANGQDLRPLDLEQVARTQAALKAHREGRVVSLDFETGEWTIDG